MENIKTWLGLGIFLNLSITLVQFSYKDTNTFKYHTRKDSYHTQLCCTPIVYGSRKILCEYQNFRDRVSKMIIQSLTVRNTPRDHN